MNLLLEILKAHPGKSISISTLTFILVLGAAAIKAGDERYMQYKAGEQIQMTLQQHQVQELETQIFILSLKEKGATQEQIDAALKERYERMLDDLKRTD